MQDLYNTLKTVIIRQDLTRGEIFTMFKSSTYYILASKLSGDFSLELSPLNYKFYLLCSFFVFTFLPVMET